MLVCDIMTLSPECCLSTSTAREAAELLRARAVGILLVVDEMATKKLVGVVTDRDICVRVVAEGKDPATAAVGECMTAAAVTCAPGEPIARALAKMREHRVRRLPVAGGDGRVTGLLSLTDIIRYASLPEPEVLAALGRIWEPTGPLGRPAEGPAEAVAR